jgi:hypothetical protein
VVVVARTGESVTLSLGGHRVQCGL